MDTKISALTNYTPPLDADVLPIVDSANSATKKLSWANLKATLKTYFDTLYMATGTAGITWNNVTGTSQAMAVNNGYIANNASLVTLTLPSTAIVGSIIRVVGAGAGGYSIAQNSGQKIHYGNTVTTTGVTGSITPSAQYEALELICITANTDWQVISSEGNSFIN